MNLADLVRYWGRWRPEHPAIIFGDQTVSWRELDAVSDAVARGLTAEGVGQGDRVGILMGNRPEVAFVALATLKLGAVCVPLNFRLTAIELAPLVEDAGCRAVVTETAFAPLLEIAAKTVDFETYSVDGTDVRPYTSLVLEVGSPPEVLIELDDPAFICYTSGTTGVQKGAVLTHRSVLHPAQAKALAEGLTWRDRMLVAVPMVFTGAIISCFMQVTVYLGATLVLEADFNPDRYLEVIERQRVTAWTSVPVVWERVAQSPGFATRDLSSLVSANVGGAPVRLDLIETFRERGIPLIQVYGMTESSGLAATIRPDDAVDRVGFAGLPIVGTQIRIGAEDRSTLPPGEIGEILIRGPHVMRGYWNRPEATADTIVDGWLASGDRGLQDDQGFLKVVDRTKDMLISGGINVYPAEIERALAGVDGIVDLAVIGVPDAKWGEVPMIVVHGTREPEGVLADIEAIGRSQLAGFKRPKYAVVSDEPLPRTFSGKLAKPVLRQRYPAAPPDAIPIFPSSG
jgi:fatty-acyl-CoA synthase